ncbi:NTP transferase domain-containing protein [Candidatus Babeliales bacterium]|nr:NTP transferase domain-containing protein [Candidatus Babeliales bacterium]
MLPNIQAIILAGGTCEKFQTGKTKFIEKICGTPMILYPLNLMESLKIPTTIVIGPQSEDLKKIIYKHNSNSTVLLQQEALGSGHAAQLSQPTWNQNHILIMNGNIPLITSDIIYKLYRKHIKLDADVSFITAHTQDITTSSHSRVVIDNNQIQVKPSNHCNVDNNTQCCISAGIYLIKKSCLEQCIHLLSKNETTGQFYLPELIQIASQHRAKIITTEVSLDIIRSVDTLADLWAVEHIKRSELLQHWMDHGVRFANTFSVHIDSSVRIQPGSYIGAGALLIGQTTIKTGAHIGAYTRIENSIIENHVTIPDHVIITNSIITQSANLKPFTNIEGLSPKSNHDAMFAGAFKTGFQDQHNF